MCYNDMSIKVKRLEKGDTIGLVAPSGALGEPSQLGEAVKLLNDWGYEVKVGVSCGKQYGYLSGTDGVRSADINGMFADAGVKAIVCLRGGYGVTRMLGGVDFGLVAKNPKLVVGYSDITALHMANYAMTGLVGLHAPMPAGGIDDRSKPSIDAWLSGEAVGKPIVNFDDTKAACVNPGQAQGALVGGNLSLIAALTGTKYMPDLRGKLLLIEEVSEYTYAIDRMLTHLRLAGVFDKCAGIVFGSFERCSSEYPDRPMSVDKIIEDVVAPCKKPIIKDLRIGHCRPALSVALGIRYRLDADKGELIPTESMFYD